MGAAKSLKAPKRSERAAEKGKIVEDPTMRIRFRENEAASFENTPHKDILETDFSGSGNVNATQGAGKRNTE